MDLLDQEDNTSVLENSTASYLEEMPVTSTTPVRKNKKYSDSFCAVKASAKVSENVDTSSEKDKGDIAESNSTASCIVIDSGDDDDDFVQTTPQSIIKKSKKRKRNNASACSTPNSTKKSIMEYFRGNSEKKERLVNTSVNNVKSGILSANSKFLSHRCESGSDDTSANGSVIDPTKRELTKVAGNSAAKNVSIKEATEGTEQSGTDQWSCNMCTFLNHAALKYCEMCESPKNKVKKRKTFGCDNSGLANDISAEDTSDLLVDTCFSNSANLNTGTDVSETVNGSSTPVPSKYFCGIANTEQSFVAKRKEVVIENTLPRNFSDVIQEMGVAETEVNPDSTALNPICNEVKASNSKVQTNSYEVKNSHDINPNSNEVKHGSCEVKHDPVVIKSDCKLVKKVPGSGIPAEKSVAPGGSGKKYRFKTLHKGSTPIRGPLLGSSLYGSKEDGHTTNVLENARSEKNSHKMIAANKEPEINGILSVHETKLEEGFKSPGKGLKKADEDVTSPEVDPPADTQQVDNIGRILSVIRSFG